jgi:hypothetical protein
MPEFARRAQGKKPSFVDRVIDIQRPFSNFTFIDKTFPGLTPLRRIMSQVRHHGGKTMVVEELEVSDDLRQENEDIEVRFPGSNVPIVFFYKVF